MSAQIDRPPRDAVHVTDTDADPRVGPGAWSVLRPLVLRLHFYAGLLIAPFLLVAACTGLLYTATPQLEQIAYHDLTHVTPGRATVPLSTQVDAARAAHPSGDVLEVDPPEAGDRSTRVVFSDDTVPADYAMSVFVDPYDGQVVGQVRSFGQWLGIRAWIDELHRNLHLGALGRNYSELAASWLWVVLLGGLALWIGRLHREGRLRRLLLLDRGRPGRARTRSWHAFVGVWIAAGLLGLSVSGLTWSRYTGAHISDLRTALAWTTPAPSTSVDHTDGEDANSSSPTAVGRAEPDAVLSEGVGIDGVYRTARAQGLGNPLYLVPPTDETSAWTAGENKRSWPTHYDTVTVDPSDGHVVDRINFASWPVMAKVSDWIVGLHMGILFGVPNQLALAALALGLIVVIIQGYRMWWQRRPRGAGATRFGPAVARGGWRRLPLPALVLGIVMTAVIGWLIPLLGLSLLGFLIIDALLGGVTGRRRTTAPRST